MYEDLKRHVLDRISALERGSAAFGLGQYITSSWLDNPRFGKWQAFHTPVGCSTTNNPLEQYHRTLKRFCNNPRASPRELIDAMNVARIAFLAEDRVFVNSPEVSTRLFKLYKQLMTHQCITATRLTSVGGVLSTKYCVRQIPVPPAANSRHERLKSIGSVNTRRIQRAGMPASGWLVDVEDSSCGCLYRSKHLVCVHVVAAAAQAGVALPGLVPPTRRFVANLQRARRSRPTRGAPERTQLSRPQPEPTLAQIPDGESLPVASEPTPVASSGIHDDSEAPSPMESVVADDETTAARDTTLVASVVALQSSLPEHEHQDIYPPAAAITSLLSNQENRTSHKTPLSEPPSCRSSWTNQKASSLAQPKV